MLLKIVLTIIASGLMVAGSIQVQHLELPHTDQFCGHWGCLPPTSTLLAAHLIWFSMVLPAVVFLVVQFPLCRRAKLWRTVFLLVLLVTGSWLIWSWWELSIAVEQPLGLDWRLIGFLIFRSTDLPLLAALLGSLLGWVIAWSASRALSKRRYAALE